MDMSGFGKELPSLTAIILVDFGIFGPTLSLYIPRGMMVCGENTITIFENRGILPRNSKSLHGA